MIKAFGAGVDHWTGASITSDDDDDDDDDDEIVEVPDVSIDLSDDDEGEDGGIPIF